MNLKRFAKKVLNLYSPREYLLNKMPRNAVCAEIGCWKGSFSRQIIEQTKPEKFFMIDPYRYVSVYSDSWYGGDKNSQEELDQIYESVRSHFSDLIQNGKVEMIRANSTEAFMEFEDTFFDWVYIDGDHTYEYVKKDLENFFTKTKIGGWICGDDYGEIGWWEDGVTRAVTEFVDNNDRRVKLVKIIGSQFILQKIDN